jgi:hypothetical protein
MARMGQHHSKKRAIKGTLFRLGFQARPAEVVATLANSGVWVGESLVRAVQIEVLQDLARSDRQRVRARLPVSPPPVQRAPRMPQQRGRRH